MLQSALWHISNSVTNGKSQTAECEITKWLKDKLNSLPAEQPSEDLDKYIGELLETYPINKDIIPTEALNDYHQGLICGARKAAMWQKEQIMKSAIDATCILLPPPDLFKVLICHEVTDKLTIGQKVKVIVKEDK